MDQNTNNSFTSAPQGGDFSDIIIPNAYAAKPKGKNLKKYVVFGVIGTVVLILISLIVKAIFVDSRTMSKQEFIQFAESEDMNNIEWLENFFITVNNGVLSFDQIFNNIQYKSIKESKDSLDKVKKIIGNKKDISGNTSVKRNYAKFREAFLKRYQAYLESTEYYIKFYDSLSNKDVSRLDKQKYGDDQDKYLIIKSLSEIISASNELEQVANKNGCDVYGSFIVGNEECKTKFQILVNYKVLADNAEISKKIFLKAYKVEDYSSIEILGNYIERCLIQIR